MNTICFALDLQMRGERNGERTATIKGQREDFWRAHHEAWKRSCLNQRVYCKAAGIPRKAFDNWRVQPKVEPQRVTMVSLDVYSVEQTGTVSDRPNFMTVHRAAGPWATPGRRQTIDIHYLAIHGRGHEKVVNGQRPRQEPFFRKVPQHGSQNRPVRFDAVRPVICPHHISRPLQVRDDPRQRNL